MSGAQRAADLDCPDRPARQCPAAEILDDLAQRNAEGELDQPPAPDIAAELDGQRAARAPAAQRRMGGGAVTVIDRRFVAGLDLADGESLFNLGNSNRFREAPDGGRWPHVLDPRPAYTVSPLRVTAWRGPVTPQDDPIRNATPEGQRAFLAQVGCDQYQGFLCAPGLPADAFEARRASPG